MQSLPLLGSHQSQQLPLFEFTAQRLVTALLMEPGDRQEELLASTVAEDPILALWIAVRAEAAGQPRLDSVGEAATWLAACWSNELQWSQGGHLSAISAASFREDLNWQSRLAGALLTARLTRHLVAAASDEAAEDLVAAESAYWKGLLREAVALMLDGWQIAELPWSLPAGLAAESTAAGFDDCLQAARRLTAEVIPRVDDATASEPIGTALAAAGEQVSNELTAEALQEHLDQVTASPHDKTGGSGQLVLILDRLARFAQLEIQFMDRLENEKLAALKELAYGASHEINNPLANISSRAQTLLRDESDPERQRMLATINSQAFRAHEMISDMMLFAKPPQLDRKSVDLIELINEVLAELADDADRQGTNLVYPSSELPIVISVDAVQLAEAVKALCRNALESVGVGGQVHVSAAPMVSLRLADKEVDLQVSAGLESPEPVGAVITVQDDGPGISDQVRAHLFDPFFSGREAGRGLGFGLSKCWRIVTEHGGQIEVHCSEAKGTIFTLRFPAVANAPQEEQTGEPRAEAG